MTPRAARTTIAVLAVCAVLGGGLAAALAATRGGEEESGAGLRYRGAFYHLSSAEVAPRALGRALADDVAFQDGAVALRRISGVRVDTAVAAWTRTYPGTGSDQPYAWLLLSPDAGRGADPWSDPELRDVVLAPAPR